MLDDAASGRQHATGWPLGLRLESWMPMEAHLAVPARYDARTMSPLSEMDPFPGEPEWIEFFGVSPEVQDPADSWPYPDLSFTVEAGRESLTVGVGYHHGDASVVLRDEDGERISLTLMDCVTGFEFERRDDRDVLVILFDVDSALDPLRVQIRPRIRVMWRTSSDPTYRPRR